MLNMSWVDVRSQDMGDDGSTETAGRSNTNEGGTKDGESKLFYLITF